MSFIPTSKDPINSNYKKCWCLEGAKHIKLPIHRGKIKRAFTNKGVNI